MKVFQVPVGVFVIVGVGVEVGEAVAVEVLVDVVVLVGEFVAVEVGVGMGVLEQLDVLNLYKIWFSLSATNQLPELSAATPSVSLKSEDIPPVITPTTLPLAV